VPLATNTPRVYVDAPLAPPRTNRLYDVASVVDAPFRIAGGVEWQPDGCSPAVVRDFCDLTDKDVYGLGLSAAPSLVVYTGVQCNLVGSDDYAARARRALELGESQAVEQWLGAKIDEIVPIHTEANVEALLLHMEQQAIVTIPGRPLLHLAPDMVTRAAAAGLLTYDTGMLTTMVGTPVVVGNYPTNRAYMTPWVTVWRTPVEEHETFTGLGGTGRTNDRLAIAERLVSVGMDCVAYDDDGYGQGPIIAGGLGG